MNHKFKYYLLVIFGFILAHVTPTSCASSKVQATYGIALQGNPKYKEGQPFDYVNPKAPVGGQIKMAVTGTFDSLNPFITKGTPPAGLSLFSEPLIFEPLMIRAKDEPFSIYGHLAESVEVATDRSWIIFNLRPEARWADGQPITAKDVVFTHALLKEKGRPNLQLFYSKVAKVKEMGPLKIKFSFNKIEGEDRYDPELPLLIGLMNVLPKHILENKDFEKVSLQPFIGSGPYKIKAFKPGHSITYERRGDYWGWHLPLNKGRYNFNIVQYDFYRDEKISFEAFKTHEYDLRGEPDPARWVTSYNFKAIKTGQVKAIELPVAQPVGVHAFVFNTRKPIFHDPRVREALAYAFDFEWLNKNIFHNAYVRQRSFYDNTELASSGLPQGKELELLEPFRNQLPAEVFTKEYNPPSLDKLGNTRKNLHKARELLKKAGWDLSRKGAINTKTKEPFTFEILIAQQQVIDEKIALAFIRTLKLLGIHARLRLVDSAQYENRRMTFDYDVLLNTAWGATCSPGREQTFYFSTKAADEPGSRNYPGIKSPAVDYLCDILATAQDRSTLVAAARALDRVLLWGHYIIPFGYRNTAYLAYWDKFDHPPFKPEIPIQISTWWAKDVKIELKKGE
ncbi:MAG: ABC transporter substrate-binding protein [Alphaproteobacteria bacterium]|nr:ABC transporter substrate-binding protein [Alphaproteobacteria bacterium]